MSHTFSYLSAITFLPLLGCLFIWLIRGDEEVVARNARYVALWTTLATFALSIFMFLEFDPHSNGFQFLEQHIWIPSFNVYYTLGVDGLSIWFVLLTTFLMPLCILASWKSITFRVKDYMMAFLVLETLVIGMFCALDVFLFYVFFEGVLIPMFLLIGIWGGEDRLYACYKFFLYTLLGSVLMLVAILAIYYETGTTDYLVIKNHNFSFTTQCWLWLAFFASFSVKVPMFPVHTWLADAHVQAPTAASVILAGVLLKMGGYGFIRYSLPFFPEASQAFAPFVYFLSIIAIIYTSLVALSQKDMKKLIAYSSVAHMGIVTLGIFTLDEKGINGAVIQMLSHGLVSAGLFLCVGVVYDRFHTREISSYGGLVNKMPLYASVFLVLTLASAGLPGTSGFVGEILVLIQSFAIKPSVAVLAGTGMILGASYGLWLYKRVCLGELKTTLDMKYLTDLTGFEKFSLGSLCILSLVMGIYPSLFTKALLPYTKSLIDFLNQHSVQQGDTLSVISTLKSSLLHFTSFK